MNEEGVAEVDVAGSARGLGERSVIGGGHSSFGQVDERQAGLFLGLEKGGHVQMGTDPDPGRRVVLSHVGHQEQHQ